MLEIQEKLRGSLEHIDLLSAEHKEALKQKEELIKLQIKQGQKQKKQIGRLKDQNECLAKKYQTLIQGCAALYQQ